MFPVSKYPFDYNDQVNWFQLFEKNVYYYVDRICTFYKSYKLQGSRTEINKTFQLIQHSVNELRIYLKNVYDYIESESYLCSLVSFNMKTFTIQFILQIIKSNLKHVNSIYFAMYDLYMENQPMPLPMGEVLALDEMQKEFCIR